MLHRLWSMLTDFSGDEGGENLMGCFAVLSIIGFLIIVSVLVTIL